MKTPPHPEVSTRTASVDKLQACLRCELSAVKTYELALESPPLLGLYRTLQEILMSHLRRTSQLRERLLRLGVEPARTSRAWDTFVDAVLPGRQAAIAALEDGESRGLDLYEDNVAACDLWTRTLIPADFLREQQRTRDLCWSLKRYVATPS
jgi:hypothetical protein